MKVILRKDVKGRGRTGDIVEVANGYARNFLIPQRIARRATAAAIAEFEAKRAELEKAAAAKLAQAQAQGEKMIEAAKASIESEKNAAMAELKNQVSSNLIFLSKFTNL